MLDIHPPHHAANTWRDFFIHIITIVIGLLIALSLESGVEALHRRHILHVAETNLHAELRENADLLAKDQRALDSAQKQYLNNLAILNAARNHTAVTAEPTFAWLWSGTQNAAWNTARDTGALSLMPYETAQGFSMVYGQQGIVEHQSGIYITDIYRAGAPLEGGQKLSTLTPAQLDTMIAATQQTLADLKYLEDLSRGLDALYKDAKTKL